MTQPKPSSPVRASKGLVNPEVTLRKPSTPASKHPAPQPQTSTHIPEPRVQRIISLTIVLCIVAIEIWFWLHRHK